MGAWALPVQVPRVVIPFSHLTEPSMQFSALWPYTELWLDIEASFSGTEERGGGGGGDCGRGGDCGGGGGGGGSGGGSGSGNVGGSGDVGGNGCSDSGDRGRRAGPAGDVGGGIRGACACTGSRSSGEVADTAYSNMTAPIATKTHPATHSHSCE